MIKAFVDRCQSFLLSVPVFFFFFELYFISFFFLPGDRLKEGFESFFFKRDGCQRGIQKEAMAGSKYVAFN